MTLYIFVLLRERQPATDLMLLYFKDFREQKQKGTTGRAVRVKPGGPQGTLTDGVTKCFTVKKHLCFLDFYLDATGEVHPIISCDLVCFKLIQLLS